MGAKEMKNVSVIVSALLVACAGKLDYTRPVAPAVNTSNTKIIDRPRDAVWNATVPELGKQFFVINNLDRASGLINISYSGDPERYIDCGRITSLVQNAQGTRTYDFPGAKAHQVYEVMNPAVGLFYIDRRMIVEGRINLIFEETSSSTTLVTANTRYVVTRTNTIRNAADNIPHTSTDTISFNSGGGSSFPPNSRGMALECAATGTLEHEVLSKVR
jgi:hypothetical protein